MNKRLLVDEIAAAIRTRPAPVGAASLAETIMEEVFPSDGCVVEGVFYPFMVDCPNCGGTGIEGVVPVVDRGTGEHLGDEPYRCRCESGKVRNPKADEILKGLCNHE